MDGERAPGGLAALLAELETSTLAHRVVRDAPLGARTTYRVGGTAAALIEVADAAELARLATHTARYRPEVLVVGRGSNLLVADAGFDGLAVVLGDGFETVEITGTRLVAGGAAKFPVVARATAAAGLTGFEWAVGVPASVGGAVRMNAGGHGSDVAASLVWAEVVNLRTGARATRPAAELRLGYRSSAIGSHDVVVAAAFELTPGDAATARATIDEIVRWRREHQPGGQNAGSVFTNPPGDSAGRLIDAAGLKGLRIGTAEVSTRHANFIQADPGGRADDVRALMDEIVARVREVHGVTLHPETRLVGFPDRPVGD